ncbi:META domain-containing protein [Mangrovibacterium sp.]|uniref:META domain-containing protein n=1 Tax=Mangrovibacterium sp. TaxID=1961364 RepID=UPI00356A4E4D
MKNRITKRFKLIIFLVAMLVSASCQKTEGPTEQIFQSWEVTGFVSIESITYAKSDDTPIILTLDAGNTYSLQLNTNSCGGDLLKISGLSIQFDRPTCTEACCDSPFAERVVELLPSVSMYKVEDNTLRLSITDWGFIECELVEN